MTRFYKQFIKIVFFLRRTLLIIDIFENQAYILKYKKLFRFEKAKFKIKMIKNLQNLMKK